MQLSQLSPVPLPAPLAAPFSGSCSFSSLEAAPARANSPHDVSHVWSDWVNWSGSVPSGLRPREAGAAALDGHRDAEQVPRQEQPCLNQYYLLRNNQEFPG